MSSVNVGQRLDFDIVFSTRQDLYRISKRWEANDVQKTKTTMSKLKKDEGAVPKLKQVLSQLMKDVSTMNMAFTFDLNGSARKVALWAHQSILGQQSSFATLIKKLKDVESDPSRPEAPFGIKTIHVTEYTLETYCALVRYLYTSEIKLEVNLEEFAVGYSPSKEFSPSCKNRHIVKGLFPSEDTASPNAESSQSDEILAFELEETFPLEESDESEESVVPERATTWSNLFQIADCYQVTELREYCLDKIVGTLDASTALEVLFGFAYRYPDLKKIVLQVVADNMPSLYAASQDPFAAFENHSERQMLMAEAFQLVFKAKAQF
ncbi:hypothetical protein CPB97_001110 [Podila verticillata]|nr:hypothetical protein CPB97_001110 [Podila verticillata]